MRKITKVIGFEPKSLKQFKASYPHATYKELTKVERQDINAECLKDQYYLCAYCCQSISGLLHDSMNEHVEARRIAPNRSLDFTNIVASCTRLRQCDDSHGSQPLLLTPFMKECETEIEFTLSGRAVGKTPRAKETIKVLNLGDLEKNNRALIERRKQLVNAILFKNGVDPAEGLDDNDLIASVITYISQPHNGKLESFSPVVVNVLKKWIT